MAPSSRAGLPRSRNSGDNLWASNLWAENLNDGKEHARGNRGSIGMQTHAYITDIGRFLRRMDSVSPYLPADFLAVLMRLHHREIADLQRCPGCRRGNALALSREAGPGENLDVLRCRFCDQVVLELSEKRRRDLDLA
jgi:hypothetical protein